MTDYSQHIQTCLDKVDKGECRLNKKALDLKGMSDSNLRTLLNFLLELPNVKYLEVGTWRGATLYSATYKNNPTYIHAIDNFCQFSCDGVGPDRKQILDFKVFIEGLFEGGENEYCKFDFTDSDCFNVDKSRIQQPINVYFYDAGHTAEDQYKALDYFYDVLEDEFIYICDDWSHPEVREGTNRAIKDTNLQTINQWEPDYNHGILVAHMQKTIL
tara:strand:- start:56 stop:700 length:645 start_codon:yes stop_codon:yes gene_type:complete